MPMKTTMTQSHRSSVALKMIENLGGLVSMMKNCGGRWTNHSEEFICIVFASFTDESMISNQICGVVHDLLGKGYGEVSTMKRFKQGLKLRKKSRTVNVMHF